MNTLLVLLSTVAIGTALEAAAPCEQPTIGRCSIGMSLTDLEPLLPAAQIDKGDDGTQLVTAKVTNPFPKLSFSDGTLRATLDISGQVVKFWYRGTTVQSEQDMLAAAKQAWGNQVWVHGGDGVNGAGRTYLMNARWSVRCGVEPRLNISIEGEPQITTVHFLLVRDTK